MLTIGWIMLRERVRVGTQALQTSAQARQARYIPDQMLNNLAIIATTVEQAVPMLSKVEGGVPHDA